MNHAPVVVTVPLAHNMLVEEIHNHLASALVIVVLSSTEKMPVKIALDLDQRAISIANTDALMELHCPTNMEAAIPAAMVVDTRQAGKNPLLLVTLNESS